ncbi:AraC family transcriptional regulator [Priestia megaterium]|uniref:AraC family transcriptional regulator n=1 Tax=Priestia megaterium TaxID=1404 RepID=UPI000BFB797A|nr:helix-turn-helix domain-containing protein [Priestia megaterium]PGK31695.1 AraC family transcriptional regulator [Priestia megaterium]
MDKFVAGKITLNEYIQRTESNGVSFYVHYWGVMPQHYNNVLHKHSFFEVCYVLEGEGTYIDQGCTYQIKENTMFLSRPDVLHQIKSDTGLFLLYVGFELIESESSEKWVTIIEEVKQCSEVVIDVKEDEAVPLMWKSLLIQATKSESVFLEEILSNLAHSLILLLIQTFGTSSNHHNQKAVQKKSSLTLNLAKLYIKDNLSNSIKLTDTATHLHLSSRHLSRLFKAELGISYSEYVQNERIQRAATLLKTTDLSIRDIAQETGFPDVQYFTRVFTALMHSSPGRFRALYIKLKTVIYKD